MNLVFVGKAPTQRQFIQASVHQRPHCPAQLWSRTEPRAFETLSVSEAGQYFPFFFSLQNK